MITRADIANAIRLAELSGATLCVHASLKSFGYVDGGAHTVVQAFLDKGCTIIVPTFTFTSVTPPIDWRPPRNGYNYDYVPKTGGGEGRRYSPVQNDLDVNDMGRIPEAVLQLKDRARGDHPLNSFAAAGPLALRVIAGQRPLDVYAPLRELVTGNGYVALIGVGLRKLTLIHLAEQMSGRSLFRRWGTYSDGSRVEAQVGGCSDGFESLNEAIEPITKRIAVGASEWRILSAPQALQVATEAILNNPGITHCANPACARCNDAILGGPR